jgi:endonuclease/exonuclease/phosphatase family metal-dependent hydrolase
MKYVAAGVVAAFVVAVLAMPRRLSPHPIDPVSGPAVAVVTLNMAKEPDPAVVLHDLASVPRLRDADIFLLQEVSNREGQPSVAEQVAKRLGYQTAFSPAAPGVYDQGLAVISRYPLSGVHVQRLKYCDLRYRCRTRFALRVEAATPFGGLRLWNVHLDTRINAGERLEQLAPVIDDAAKTAGPRLIGGDFNTNDFYWLGNVAPFPAGPSHGGAVRRAMEQHGFNTPLADSVTTFPVMNRHLDWIFLNQADALGSSVEPVAFSDHHAVWMRIRLSR